MSESKWHGWTIEDVLGERSLMLCKFPDRTRIALVRESRSELHILAYFQSETAAEIAMDMIDQLARVGRYEPTKETDR